MLSPFADGEYWVVGQPLVYPIPDSDAVIIIPAGFVTDFASIPRIFWTIFPRHGEYTTAAIVHDYLYWEQKCTREQADNLFFMVMEQADVSTASRWAIYSAVRLGGALAWDENASLKKSGEVRILPARLMDFGVKEKWLSYKEKIKPYFEAKEEDGHIPLYCSALEVDEEKKIIDKQEQESLPSKEDDATQEDSTTKEMKRDAGTEIEADNHSDL
ncbi:MAG: DUF1353 domain-containing protein [Gammaproteobacteria bacterium]|nr:DUF1353 domain-containing protein [Gammaproteobacteria bacterium]MDH5777839.1 DUF1353 domain-containing protein [Gammaproteobacteria bacterium]